MCCLLDLIPANKEVCGDLRAEGSLCFTDSELIKVGIQKGGGDRKKAGL